MIPESMKGSELRMIRKRLNLTQAQLAGELGVTTNTVARWERGERSISEPMSRLIRILRTKTTPKVNR